MNHYVVCLCVCVIIVFVVFRTQKLCENIGGQLYSCYIAILLMRWTYTYLHIQQHTQLTHSPSSRHCSLSLSVPISPPLPRFPFFSVLEKHWKSTAVDSCSLFSQSELSFVVTGTQTQSTVQYLPHNKQLERAHTLSLFLLLLVLSTARMPVYYMWQAALQTTDLHRHSRGSPGGLQPTEPLMLTQIFCSERDGTCPLQSAEIKMKIKVQWWWFEVTTWNFPSLLHVWCVNVQDSSEGKSVKSILR